MYNNFMFEGKEWYEYLDEPMRDLVDEAYYLLDQEQLRGSGLHDYSFVVFPMAKAYEGFLKKLLFKTGLISVEDLEDKYFRIGKSLNPELPKEFRSGRWVYDQLEIRCKDEGVHGGKNLAWILWDGWKQGRNKIFHYFIGHEQFISLEEAGERIELIRNAMEETLKCSNLVKR